MNPETPLLQDELPRSEGVQYAPGEEQRRTTNSLRRMKRLDLIGNDAQLWICQLTKVKSDAAKNSTALQPEMLGQ